MQRVVLFLLFVLFVRADDMLLLESETNPVRGTLPFRLVGIIVGDLGQDRVWKSCRRQRTQTRKPAESS
mgnify:CR=1 FL=1